MLTDAISAHRTRTGLVAATVEDVLAQLLALVDVDAARVERARDAVTLRARTGVFGVGRGLALPHGYVAGWGGTELTIATLATPLDFDGRSSDLIVLVVSDPLLPARHNEVLSSLADRLNAPGRMAALRAARSGPALLSALNGDVIPAAPAA